jgi:hypothetical protein
VPVADHARHRLRQVELDARAALARLQPHQRQHRVAQQVGAHRLARLLAPAHEVVHALDHAAGPLGLLGDALPRPGAAAAPSRRSRRRRRSIRFQRAGRIARDRGERLVQLVAQQRGHLADGGQPAPSPAAALCCWRETSSILRCALTSSAALIQPVWRPAPSTSGASKISTAKALAVLAHEDVSKPSRGAAPVAGRRRGLRWRCAYSARSSGGQYGGVLARSARRR